MNAIDDAGWYQIITAFPQALTTVGWLRENGEWFIPDPDFNEASVIGARLSRLIPETEILEPTGVLANETKEFQMEGEPGTWWPVNAIGGEQLDGVRIRMRTITASEWIYL